MLVQLTLKNFKIFKEETLLDCIPGPINEHKASLIKDPLDGEQFLPVISIYGPNSGGKSTVLQGLTYLSALITSPASPSSTPAAPQQLSYCMDPACSGIPTEFDVLFRHSNKTLYGALSRHRLHLNCTRRSRHSFRLHSRMSRCDAPSRHRLRPNCTHRSHHSFHLHNIQARDSEQPFYVLYRDVQMLHWTNFRPRLPPMPLLLLFLLHFSA